MAAALAHYTDPPEHAPLYERVGRAVVAAFTAAGGDANFGARLIRAFKDAGLVNIAAEARTPLVAGGPRSGSRGPSSISLNTWWAAGWSPPATSSRFLP